MDNPIRNIDPGGIWAATSNGSGVTTSDPEEIAAILNQWNADSGDDPKSGGKEKKEPNPPKNESFWHGFVQGISGIGSATEYKEKFDSGDYLGAAAALGMFTFDLFTLGNATAEKTVTEGVVNFEPRNKIIYPMVYF